MKNIYRTLTIILVLAVALPLFAIAGETASKPVPNVNLIEKAYLASLRHENAGVVESAILQTTVINIMRDDIHLPKVEREVKRLARKGSTAEIRYKAYIASNFLTNPELVKSTNLPEKLEGVTDENRNEFYATLANALNTKLLGE